MEKSNFVIIGGSSGIGAQLAHLLAGAGHKVVATYYRNKPNLDQPNITSQYLNVLDETPDLGFLPERIDGLAYCPGTIKLRPFSRLESSDFITDYQLQVVGAVKVIQAALNGLKTSPQSAIILFSTVAAQYGFNFHSLVGTNKGAVEGLTRALAAEFAPRIRVNCIAPSLTDTPLAASLLSSDEKRAANAKRHPMKRIGSTTDMMNMAEFLLTNRSSWITGQIFAVDGGLSRLRV